MLGAAFSVGGFACAQDTPPAAPGAQEAETKPATETSEAARQKDNTERERPRRIRTELRTAPPLARVYSGDRERVLRKIGRKENVTYLGVSTSPVPQVLRKQLTIPRGVGLVVDSITQDSPAAKGGLEEDDVLVRFDDQILVNTEQLGVLVRIKKPGDTANLTVIRQGQERVLTVTLSEKEMMVSDAGDVQADWTMDLGPGLLAPSANVRIFGEADVDGLRDILLEGMKIGDVHMIFKDGEHSLEVTRKDGQRHLVAKDADDQVIFDGPVETEEQRQAVPENIAGKLQQLLDSEGLRGATGPVQIRILKP
jgi:hypothetical protein